MVKFIAAWALLAAVIVQATPTPIDSSDVELEARNLDMEARDIELDPRDFDLEERDIEIETREYEIQERDAEFDPRDLDLEERDVESRAVKTSAGLADFEAVAAASSAQALKEIGYYGGLSWQGIAAVKATSILSGIKAYSPTTVGAYGLLTKLLNNSPTLTTDFSGSTTQSFSISSFYFGCTGLLSVGPTKCTIALAGYNKAGKLIASQKVGFVPVQGLSSSMQFVQLPSTFTGLSYVRFATTYSGVGLLGTTALDNVKYTITKTA